MAFLCDIAVGEAGILALVDVASLNHCLLYQSINRVRNYERPIDLVNRRTARSLPPPDSLVVLRRAVLAPHRRLRERWTTGEALEVGLDQVAGFFGELPAAPRCLITWSPGCLFCIPAELDE
jgi:hypothetical protein